MGIASVSATYTSKTSDQTSYCLVFEKFRTSTLTVIDKLHKVLAVVDIDRPLTA